jgi:hypothetical protein
MFELSEPDRRMANLSSESPPRDELPNARSSFCCLLAWTLECSSVQVCCYLLDCRFEPRVPASTQIADNKASWSEKQGSDQCQAIVKTVYFPCITVSSPYSEQSVRHTYHLLASFLPAVESPPTTWCQFPGTSTRQTVHEAFVPVIVCNCVCRPV